MERIVSKWKYKKEFGTVGNRTSKQIQKEIDYGEGSASNAGFPPMPSWFKDNRHFGAIAAGLRQQGFSEKDTNAVMGENWLRFYDENFGAETA